MKLQIKLTIKTQILNDDLIPVKEKLKQYGYGN